MEKQAVNGLRRWADNFPKVAAAIISHPEKKVSNLKSMAWVPIDEQAGLDAVELIELPCAYGIFKHLMNYSRSKWVISLYIQRSRYLSFAIGGFFGDWGSLAALIASSKSRPFSVWTDRVESDVIYEEAIRNPNYLKKIKGVVYSYVVCLYERYVIKKATLGLFHGQDTYDAYGELIANKESVANVHLSVLDRISASGLQQKTSLLNENAYRAALVHDIHLSLSDRLAEANYLKKTEQLGRRKLRIGYAGRADLMKAPLDWVQVLHMLKLDGVEFEAEWIGDGQLLDEMKKMASSLGLGGQVTFHGFVGDREIVLNKIRSWDLLLFTHITKESPRILIEALVSATPIVGYETGYSRNLVAGFGEKYLVRMGDMKGLAEVLKRIDQDRGMLSRLMIDSYMSSATLNDVSVFKHRSDLIKKFL